MPLTDLSPQMYATIGLVAAFGSIVTLLATGGAAVAARRQVYRSLRTVKAIELANSRDIGRRALAAPAMSRLVVPAMRKMADIGRRVTPASVIDRLERELAHAGSPAGWDAGRVLALKVLMPAVLVAGSLILGPLVMSGLAVVALAAVLGIVGYYLPEWVVRSKAGERQGAIRRSLPDSLDLLSITVEAGLGFDAALSRVAREIEGPLGQEFGRVVQEMQLGQERVQALRALADRNNVAELKSFVLAMIQADILGIAVSNVLQVQAREMRLKRRQRAEERAQKLPVKIVFPLIFCIFPALFIVILGPAIIQISESLLQMF